MTIQHYTKKYEADPPRQGDFCNALQPSAPSESNLTPSIPLVEATVVPHHYQQPGSSPPTYPSSMVPHYEEPTSSPLTYPSSSAPGGGVVVPPQSYYQAPPQVMGPAGQQPYGAGSQLMYQDERTGACKICGLSLLVVFLLCCCCLLPAIILPVYFFAIAVRTTTDILENLDDNFFNITGDTNFTSSEYGN